VALIGGLPVVQVIFVVERDQVRRQANSTLFGPRWLAWVLPTAAVGLVYFVIAELGLGLYGQTNWVSVFWPAYGISAGVLIALGPSARLQVAAGVIIAILAAHWIVSDPSWLGPAFALSDAAEAVVAAGVVYHIFGSEFSLGRLRDVLGLLIAAAAGSLASFTVWIVPSKLFQSSTEPLLRTWQHWFLGDITGFVALGPFVIELLAAVRKPPAPRELAEGATALVGLTAMTVAIIFLPNQYWQTSLPVAWLFPILFWLARRCQPIFAAAGTFVVSITVVWTTVFGVGHFGNAGLSTANRNLQAQVTILAVGIGAIVLSALFDERRQSEASLTLSKALLERKRHNKFLNIDAATASIVHEVRQPLSAINLNASTALSLLAKAPPDIDNLQASLDDIVAHAKRIDAALSSIRSLFNQTNQERQPVNTSEIIREVLTSVRHELEHHEISSRPELASELPFVEGDRAQLQQVMLNLVHNAIEAMRETTGRNRELRISTERRTETAIAVVVQDTGAGIDPNLPDNIFEPFISTKAGGMGLGLAISQTIVARHGGQISVLSDSGGSQFNVVLPIWMTGDPYPVVFC
jgi:signal transduction histidine kinase